MTASSVTEFRAVGSALPRADGQLKVTGAATYGAEWPVDGLVHGALVDSAIAKGTIRRIEASEALAAPGVLAVVSHENAPRLAPYPETGAGFALSGEGGLGEAPQTVHEPKNYYGPQSIAVVVAETFEQARHAATLVRVEYDAEPPAVDMKDATETVAPELFAGAEPLQKDGDGARDVLAAAPISRSYEYETPIHHHNPIELLCTIAVWDFVDEEHHLTLYDTTRAVHMVRDFIAQSLELPAGNVRVVSHFIGGAFGSKAWTFHNPLLAALAARVVGRPVKVEWRRQQVYSTAGHRPAMLHTVGLGGERDGRLSTIVHDSRTHSSTVSGYTEFGARMTKMMYGAPHVGYSNRLAQLNLPSPCVMRGPGFAMGAFALESALDELAVELGVDPIELRLQNYAEIDPESGHPFSDKRLRECYERAGTRFGWAERRARPGRRPDGDVALGIGMASTMHPADQQEATAQVTLFADGTALARSATHELGNGSYTIFRQIAADGLRLPVEAVRFELGDTDYPAAPPTHGSLTTASIGPAVFEAAGAAIAALKEIAVGDPGSPLFGAKVDDVDAEGGRLVRRDDPASADDYAAIMGRAKLPQVSGGGTQTPGEEREHMAFYSFGAVFAEVRVDVATGIVRVARLCGAYDTGRLINPKTAHSQLMGGMIMGLGAALMEESLFDPNTGLPVVRNLADYHFPSNADVPEITIEALDIPDSNISELGARGVGEMGGTGVPAAIANAIFDATGARVRKLPMTPDTVLAALEEADA